MGQFEINVVSQYTALQNDMGGVATSLEVNYGITDRFQSHAYLPFDFDKPANASARMGLGDAEFGFKYRFFDDGSSGWAAAIAPSVDVPPAGLNHRFTTGDTEIYLPILVSRQWGDWTAFGEESYVVNPGANNRDWQFSGLAIAYDISPKVTVGGEVLYTTAAAAGAKGGAGFNLTTTYNIDQTYHLLLSVGRNVTNVDVVNKFSALAGIQFTF